MPEIKAGGKSRTVFVRNAVQIKHHARAPRFETKTHLVRAMQIVSRNNHARRHRGRMYFTHLPPDAQSRVLDRGKSKVMKHFDPRIHAWTKAPKSETVGDTARRLGLDGMALSNPFANLDPQIAWALLRYAWFANTIVPTTVSPMWLILIQVAEIHTSCYSCYYSFNRGLCTHTLLATSYLYRRTIAYRVVAHVEIVNTNDAPFPVKLMQIHRRHLDDSVSIMLPTKICACGRYGTVKPVNACFRLQSHWLCLTCQRR
jgi:hypothetical protein